MDKEFDKCPFCKSTNIEPLKGKSQQEYKCKNCGITLWSSERGIGASSEGFQPTPRPG